MSLWTHGFENRGVYSGNPFEEEKWAERMTFPLQLQSVKHGSVEMIDVLVECDPGFELGWEAGIRTPITCSRGMRPTVGRPPNAGRCAPDGRELLIIAQRPALGVQSSVSSAVNDRYGRLSVPIICSGFDMPPICGSSDPSTGAVCSCLRR